MFNRRKFLETTSCGFGNLALLGLAGTQAKAATQGNMDPLAPKQPHHTPKAKRIIFLFMQVKPFFFFRSLLMHKNKKRFFFFTVGSPFFHLFSM